MRASFVSPRLAGLVLAGVLVSPGAARAQAASPGDRRYEMPSWRPRSTLLVSLTSFAVGIPLLAIGAEKVPERPAAASLVPALRVGAGGGVATWRF